MVFLWFSPLKRKFSYGVPMIFLWLCYSPIETPVIFPGSQVPQSAPLHCHAPVPSVPATAHVTPVSSPCQATVSQSATRMDLEDGHIPWKTAGSHRRNMDHGKTWEIVGKHGNIVGTHGKNMEKSWEIVGKHGKIVGTHGKIMEKSWEIVGKTWKIFGKIVGKHGKSWENRGKTWKIMGKSWENMENHGNMVGKWWENMKKT